LPFSTHAANIKRRSKQPYPANPTTIGEHLLKVRIDRELTKVAVANEIGVTSSTIGLWEQGKGNPEVTQMKGIIAFLGYYPLPEPVTLGDQVRKYRCIRGLTLEEFGTLLGVSMATVSTWECGRYMPAETTVQKITDLINQKELL